MAIVTTDNRHYTTIADAIRAKNGTQEQYRPDQMAAAIEEIPSGGTDAEDGIVERTLTDYTNNRIATIGNGAFYAFSTLKSVVAENVTNVGNSGFQFCSALSSVKLKSVKSIGNSSFASCTSLFSIVFLNISTVSASAFAGDGLETLIIASGTVARLSNANAFVNTPIQKGTGYIYVPRDLVEQYKVGTNWATYAGQFRTIEDYPEIQAMVEDMS